MSDRFLIITTATGYRFANIKLFWNSLSTSGYKGDLLLLHNATLGRADFPPAAFNLLLKRIDLHPRWMPSYLARRRHSTSSWNIPLNHYRRFSELLPARWQALFRNWMAIHYFPIYSARNMHYWLWLRQRRDHYEHILLADCSDVVFQWNPQSLHLDGDLVFAMEASTMSIGKCPLNSYWLRSLYGDDYVSRHLARPISCAGTVLGSRAGIWQYLSALCDELTAVNPKQVLVSGIDQGAHNGVLLKQMVPNSSYSYNGFGPILTMAYENDLYFPMDAQGVVRNQDGSLPCLVHQYNVKPGMLAGFTTRWS